MLENWLSAGIAVVRNRGAAGSGGRNVERAGRPPVADEIGRAEATGTSCQTSRPQSLAGNAPRTSTAPDSHDPRLLSSSRGTRWISNEKRGWRAGLDHSVAWI